MKIQIDGAGTINKGAELMLYSVLDQIEIKYPNSTVLYNSISKGEIKMETNLEIIHPFRLKYFRYFSAILRRLRISDVYFTSLHPNKNIDIVLDVSGFKFGDQWNYSTYYYKRLENYYKSLKESHTKIILLPQAFGPFERVSSKIAIEILNKYVDLIIAREEVSMKYLINSGINQHKLLLYPDFTVLTKGIFPSKHVSLKGGICIIPNNKMLTHTVHTKNEYLNFYKIIINNFHENNKIFLLNHEGENDLKLCKEINDRFQFDLPIVTNLDAKEVKGIIKESKLVISSRFHGVASALNQSVPCIVTSWSHKYKELLKYFSCEDSLLDINSSSEVIINKINHLLQPSIQKDVRARLNTRANDMYKEVEKMWRDIYESLEKAK